MKMVQLKGFAVAALVALVTTGSSAIAAGDPSTGAPPAGTWTAATPMPVARSELAVVALGGKLYVMGGSTDKIPGLTTLEEYDPATSAWRERAPLPKGLSHMGAATLDGKIYAIGGFTGIIPKGSTNHVHQGASTYAFEYDPAADSWRQLPPLSGPRGSVGVAAVDGKIHAFGGRKNPDDTVTIHQVYDPKTDRWSDAAPLPEARDHMTTVAADGLVHVIGGRFRDRDKNSDTHFIYDPKTDSWSKGAPLPTARSGMAYALYKGMILVIGGETPQYANTQNEGYDLATKSWKTLAPIPLGVHATTGATIGDHAYFPGGSTKQGGGAITDRLLVFTLP